MVDLSQTARRLRDSGALVSPPVVLAWLGVLGLGFGAALAYGAPLWLLTAMLLAPVIAWLGLVRPWAAGVILVVVIWGYISDIGVRIHGWPSIMDTVVPLLLVAIGARWLLGQGRLNNDPTAWWFAGYLAFVSLSLVYAQYPDRSQPVLIDLVKNFVIFLVIINLVSSTRMFTYAMWGLIGLGAVFGTITVYQELVGAYDDWRSVGGLVFWRVMQLAEGAADRPRASGPVYDPNIFGQQLIVLVPLSLWAALNARRRAAKLFGAYASLVTIGALALTFSRGAYLALIVVLVMLAMHIRLNPRYLLLLPVAFVLYSMAPADVRTRFFTVEELLPQQSSGPQDLRDSSFDRRSVEMLMAWYMFLDHPVVGVGADNYKPMYPTYIREYGAAVGDEERNAHSLYLEVAAEGGLIGLTLLLGAIVASISQILKARRLYDAAGEHQMAELANALLLGFVGYLVTATFIHGDFPRFLWMLVAMAAAVGIAAQRHVRGLVGPEEPAAPALS